MSSKLFRPGLVWIVLILFVSSGFLALDISRMNRAAHLEASRSFALEPAVFQDSDSDLDAVASEGLLIIPGDDICYFETAVEPVSGESWQLSLSAENRSGRPITFYADLYIYETDDTLSSFELLLPEGRSEIREQLDYSTAVLHSNPYPCILRLIVSEPADLVLSQLSITAYAQSHTPRPLASAAAAGMLGLCGVCAVYLFIGLIHTLRAPRKKKTGASLLREVPLYLASCLIVTACLFWIYRAADLALPLYTADGDEMGIFFLIRAIRENGTTLMTAFEGGAAGADMFDYPYSDKLSFLMVLFISQFTSNAYLTANLFYFLCHILCAVSALHACRKLGLSRSSSLLVSVLYAFSAYISQRYSHMWLVPYFMIPQACLLAVTVLRGKWNHLSGSLLDDSGFWRMFGLSYLFAFTGLYYAFFACAILAAAMMIRIFSDRGKHLAGNLLPSFFITAVLAGILTNVLPNLLYTFLNGPNPASELAARNPSDTEYFGLKMVQMLLPRLNHRIPAFAGAIASYSASFPLVTENMTSSLGMIASLGFLLSMVFLLSGREEYRPVAALNVSAFLIGTIGGLGTLLSLIVSNPMRCYNRISVMILFFSLVTVGLVLDHFRPRLPRWLSLAICLALTGFGLFDQTAPYHAPSYSHLLSVRQTVQQMEESLRPGDSVFVLPYDNWPSPTIVGSYRNHLLFVESDHLHWSYGAMQGREEARWQESVANAPAKAMLASLSEAGYEGLYLDRTLYTRKYGEKAAAERMAELSAELGPPAVVSPDDQLFFWRIPPADPEMKE